jgi:UrcA family protein
MTTRDFTRRAPAVLSKLTMAMLIGGLVSAASIGVAGAATSGGDVPTATVKFHSSMLATDRGARQLYARLKEAASQVCPYPSENYTNLVPAEVRACRDQALARAVLKIDNPRLAAVHESSAKNG